MGPARAREGTGLWQAQWCWLPERQQQLLIPADATSPAWETRMAPLPALPSPTVACLSRARVQDARPGTGGCTAQCGMARHKPLAAPAVAPALLPAPTGVPSPGQQAGHAQGARMPQGPGVLMPTGVWDSQGTRGRGYPEAQRAWGMWGAQSTRWAQGTWDAPEVQASQGSRGAEGVGCPWSPVCPGHAGHQNAHCAQDAHSTWDAQSTRDACRVCGTWDVCGARDAHGAQDACGAQDAHGARDAHSTWDAHSAWDACGAWDARGDWHAHRT